MQPKTNAVRLNLCILSLLVFISCSRSYVNEKEIREAAQPTIDSFYSNIESKEWTGNHQYLSHTFLSKTSSAEMDSMLIFSQRKYGNYHAKYLEDWHSIRTVANDSEEVSCIFIYNVQYQKGEQVERISLTRENGSYKIVSYFIEFKSD